MIQESTVVAFSDYVIPENRNQIQETYTVHMEYLGDYYSVKDIDEALNFIKEYIAGCADATDGSGITIEPGALTIYKGNPQDAERQREKAMNKARRMAA